MEALEQKIDPPKVSPKDFSKKIKDKYPEYRDVDDVVLAKKMIEKYPEYSNRINFDSDIPLKKKEQSEVDMVSNSGGGSLGVSEGNKDKFRLPNENDFVEMQNKGVSPPDSEIRKRMLDNVPSDMNDLYDLKQDGSPKPKPKEISITQTHWNDKSFNRKSATIESNNKDAKAISKGVKFILPDEKKSNKTIDEAKQTEELYNFTENDVIQLKKDIDKKISDNDLNLDNPYLYYSTFDKQPKLNPNTKQYEPVQKDDFIERTFGEDKLFKIGINVADFDGFLNKKGYKNEFLDKEEKGLFEGDGNGKEGYNVEIAKEREKKRLLTLYMGEMDGRSLAKTKLEAEKRNLEKSSRSLEIIDDIEGTTQFDGKELDNYVKTEMPNLSKKISEVEAENKEIYAKHKAGETNLLYGTERFFKKAGYGFIDKINQISSVVLEKIGADERAQGLRFLNEERQISRPNTRDVGYAKGLTTKMNGTNYLFTEEGRVIDQNLKIDVTDLLQRYQYDSIKFSAKEEKKSDFTFSPQGSIIQFGGVAGDMIVQLALSKGLSFVPRLSQIPLTKSASGSIIAQTALGYTQGAFETYKMAIDAGINEKEARLIADDAGQNMALLYGATSPMSLQTKATQALFGAEGKELIKKAVNAYVQTGKKGFLETLKRGLKSIPRNAAEWAEEGLIKEGSQELTQQVGETYLVNAKINEQSGKELAKETITANEVVNTLIQTTLSGGLAVVPKMFSRTDKLSTYATLSKDPNFEKDINSLVNSGVVTNEQANVLKKDVNIFKNQVGKIPKNLSKNIAMGVMSDLQDISDLETKKKILDQSFHEDINAEIEAKRNKIKDTIKFDLLDNKEQIRLKDLAGRELMQEQNPDGTASVTLNDNEISKRAVQIYNKEVLARTAQNQNATTPEATSVADPTNIPPIPDNYNIVDDPITPPPTNTDNVVEGNPTNVVVDEGVGDVDAKRTETEAKIKRKDLFSDGVSFANQLGGSGVNSVPTNHSERNGIEFVQFSNPNTGVVDVVMSGTSDSDFVGYYRIYENGKPTDKWSSKFENKSRNKENFKTMIGGVQSMLPKGHQYTETTSISTDGLRVWEQQLSRGYELQTDNNGNIVTNEVAINGDAINNELGIEVNQGNFDNISVTTNQQFESVKKALLPYLQKFGLNDSNIRNVNGTVEIDLPVLRKTTKQTEVQQQANATEEIKPIPIVVEQATTDTKEQSNEVAPSVYESGITISNAVADNDSVFLHKGQKGEIKLDGQTVIFETKDKIIELGNKDEIANLGLENFGIEQEKEIDLTLNDDNSVTIEGKTYFNNYSNQDSAISQDKDGNYSVTLETENGQKRTFRGQRADQIVYQIKLKNFEQNATAEQIETGHQIADEVIRIEAEDTATTIERKDKVVEQAKPVAVPKEEDIKPEVSDAKPTNTDNVGVEDETPILKEEHKIENKIENKSFSDRDVEVDQEQNAKGFISLSLEKLTTSLKDFQGRAKEYSQQTYDRIVNEAKNGTLNLSSIPPIQIWRDPKTNNFIILAGHSRTKAFTDLANGNIEFSEKYTKSDFKNINSQIVEAETLQEAQKIAQESNQGAVQTVVDNAKYVRESLLPTFANRSQAKSKLSALYGMAWVKIHALANLNPKGKAMQMLKQFQDALESKSYRDAETIAEWTGKARAEFKNLTNAHEDEIFEYLLKNDKVKTYQEFSQLLNNRVNGIQEFNQNEPLNFENKVGRGSNEVEIVKQIQDLKNRETQIKNRITELQKFGKNLNETQRKEIKDLTAEVIKINTVDIPNAQVKQKEAREADSNQFDIFSQINEEIQNGNITAEQVDEFVENDRKAEEIEPIVKVVESKAESNNKTELEEVVEQVDSIVKPSIEPTQELSTVEELVTPSIKNIKNNGLKISGVTSIEFEDNNETILYGTKNNKTRISIKGMSIEQIQEEYDLDKQVFERNKNRNFEAEEVEIKKSKGMTDNEKISALNELKSSKRYNDILENITLPFYETKLNEAIQKPKTAINENVGIEPTNAGESRVSEQENTPSPVESVKKESNAGVEVTIKEIFNQDNIKEDLDWLDSLKLDPNNLSATLPFLPQVFNALIDAIKVARMAGNSLSKAIEIARQKLSGKFDAKDIDNAINAFAQKANIVVEPIKLAEKTTPKSSPKKEKPNPLDNEQAFSTRAFNSENLNQKAKDKLQALGLDYKIENQEIAQKNAEKIIAEIGILDAYNLAKAGHIRGGAKTWIMAQMFEDLNTQIDQADRNNDTELADSLSTELAEIIKYFADEKTLAGQEAAMLNRIYNRFGMKYDVGFAREKWQKQYGEDIPVEVEARLVNLEKQIKQFETDKKALEEKIGTIEEQEAIKNLQNQVRKNRTQKPSASSLTKAASALRQVKFTKLISDLSTLQSNPLVLVTTIFDGAVETIAKALDAGATIEQAVKKGIIEIKNSDWYKGLSSASKINAEKIANKQFTDFIEQEINKPKNENQSDVEIPYALLYNLVKDGVNNIQDLTEAVHKVLLDKYPNITDREVRDAITGYGKTINDTKDDIKKEISRLKTDGKQMSALDDLADGKLPKRSGRKPKNYTPEQRNRIKQIRELIKNIPINDDTDKAEYYKTAIEAYKTRVENRIKDLNEALDKNERIINEKRNTVLDQEAKDLVKQRDDLQKEYDQHFGKPYKSDETLINEIVKTKEKSLRDLEVKLETVIQTGKELPAKEKRTVSDPKIDKLTKEIESKRNELNDALEQVGIAESKRLKKAINYSKKRLNELNTKIAKGDFTRPTPRKIKYNDELVKLKGEIIIAKTKWDIEFEKAEFKKLGFGEKIIEYVYRTFGTAKGFKATADLSAMLRQGILLGTRNPKEFAIATVEMHKFAYSEVEYKKWMTDLETSKDYVYMVEDGLSITDTSGDVLKAEERFVGSLLNKKIMINNFNINIVGRIQEGSERAYGGFLNSLRVSMYRKFVAQYEIMGITREAHPKKYKSVAKFINNATGRGVMTSDKRIAKLLNIVFFSPRMITGMAGVFKDLVRTESTPYLRKQAATTLITFIGYQFAMKFLIAQALTLLSPDDDDEEITQDMNPVSTDFNKVKKGDTRYDVSAGYGIAARTAARFFLNKKSSGIDEEEKNFDDQYKENAFSEVGSFFINKLSPLSSQIYKYKTNDHPTEFYGDIEDAKVTDYLNALFVPISVANFIDDIENETPKNKLFFDLILNSYGISVQKYGDKNKE